MHETRSGRVPETKLVSPSEMWYPTGTSVCDNTQSTLTQEVLPELQYAEFFLIEVGASLVSQTVKNLPAMQEDPGSIPGSRRCPGEENGYPLQYSCLESPMNRGAWRATVLGFTKSWT